LNDSFLSWGTDGSHVDGAAYLYPRKDFGRERIVKGEGLDGLKGRRIGK
jgi:hypothetical protein